MTKVASLYDMSPLWARLAFAYEHRIANHRGKRTILQALYRLRAGRPLVWRMENGALLAIAPGELARPGTVGWSCFHNRRWEPHVERALGELLRPGDTAYDVGANLGYFSAVMAQRVGSQGRVFAFEPVAQTFELLTLCRVLNGFSQMKAFEIALGSSNGNVDLTFSPMSLGQASIHQRQDSVDLSRARVPVRRIDDLVESGELPPPHLIKIDVEGNELAVIEGALRLLAEHQPALVFELNAAMSHHAGWTGQELAARLREASDYRFFLLTDDGRRPVEPAELDLDSNTYLDVLALA
jgi:FkbM family methyltransferase